MKHEESFLLSDYEVGWESCKQQSTNVVFSGRGHDPLTEKKLYEWSRFRLQWITSRNLLVAIDNE